MNPIRTNSVAAVSLKAPRKQAPKREHKCPPKIQPKSDTKKISRCYLRIHWDATDQMWDGMMLKVSTPIRKCVLVP